MVTLYIKKGCIPCKIVKAKLDKLGIEYTQVEDDGSGKAVPRIEVDGKTITLKRFVESVIMKSKKNRGD